MHFEIFDYFLWLNTEIVLKIDWRLSSLYFLSRDDKIRYLFFFYQITLITLLRSSSFIVLCWSIKNLHRYAIANFSLSNRF